MFRKQCLMLAAVMLIQSSSSVFAFELFGKKFFEKDTDNAQIEVLDPLDYQVDLRLTTAGDDALLEKLQLGSSTYQQAEKPAAGSAGLIARARGDYRRLLATLYGEGFYAGAVSIRIAGREVSDMDLSTDLKQNVLVSISVEPGPTFRFGSTEIINPAPQPSEDDDRTARFADERFSPGQPAYGGAVGEAARIELSQWRDAAHPKAAIVGQQVAADHNTNHLNASVTIDPGPRANIGEVSVKGSKTVDSVFLRRMAHIDEGTPYSPAVLRRMRDRLNGLGVFEGVRINEPATVGENGDYPLEVIVSDRKPRRLGFGATISSIDGAGVEAFWLHRNLFGRAERLRFDFAVGGIGAADGFRDYDYLLGGTFTKPGVITPDTNLVAFANIQQEFPEHFRDRSFNLGVGVTHSLTENLNFGLSLGYSLSEVETSLGTDRFRILSLTGSAELDRRDSATEPHKGYYLSAELAPFYELNFENQAIKAILEGRTYLALGEEEETVLAVRARSGTILGGNYDELPASMLFFSGGGGSVRGYPYQGIGVEVDGETLGGRSMLELSGEIRQQITDNIGLVGFVDAGYISSETFPSEGDLNTGVGLGLRYFTALGPLRVDVGIPLDPHPGNSDYGIYVGIGQAF